MLEERTCPLCGEIYVPPTRFCHKDGSQLNATNTLIGKVLHDKYRIEDWLGGGGMATVYRATHLKIEEEVAVKVLNPELLGQERIADRFRNEAKAAMRINHPNAIRVTDFDITEERLHYLVMEIVRGRLLRDMIREARFDYRRAVKFLCQACEAIYAAHNQRIIHRDLKPDNIIIKAQGGEETVKVLDFGIARLREGDGDIGVTQPGTVIGTLAYMSPEQCRGEELSEASDIYSLGVIGYEMMTQRTPIIPAEKWSEFLKRLQVEEPPPLRQFVPEVPSEIESVIMLALEKAPEKRPASALIMSKWLQNAIREAEGRPTNPQIDVRTGIESMRLTGPLSGLIEVERDPEETIEVPRKVASPPPATAPSPVPAAAPRRTGIGLAVAAGVLVLLLAAGYALIRRKAEPGGGGDPIPATIVDDIGEMVLIPGGVFMMGDDSGDESARPVHREEVADFYLDKYEVTNQQYKKFIDATGYAAPSHWNNRNYPSGEAQLPVTHVAWVDAAAYARWANGRRLPLEKEWEYAARSGAQGYMYPWGNEWGDNPANAYKVRKGPTPVTSFTQDRNIFGVYGLAGNVSEWVEDRYLHYGTGKEIDPKCADCRVFRGGNYNSNISGCAAGARLADHATAPGASGEREEFELWTMRQVGFRCAKNK